MLFKVLISTLKKKILKVNIRPKFITIKTRLNLFLISDGVSVKVFK